MNKSQVSINFRRQEVEGNNIIRSVDEAFRLLNLGTSVEIVELGNNSLSAFYMLAAINKAMHKVAGLEMPVNTRDKVYVPFVAWKMKDGVELSCYSQECEVSQDGSKGKITIGVFDDVKDDFSDLNEPVLLPQISCASKEIAEAIVKLFPELVFTFALGSMCDVNVMCY